MNCHLSNLWYQFPCHLGTKPMSHCSFSLFSKYTAPVAQTSPAYRCQWHPIDGILSNVTGLYSQSYIKTLKDLTQTFPDRLACSGMIPLFCKYSLGPLCWSSFCYFLLGTCWAFPCSLGICHLLLNISASASVLLTCPSIFNYISQCQRSAVFCNDLSSILDYS